MELVKSRRFQGVLLALCLSSCTSNHNLNQDGTNHLGGGFSDRELSTGFHKILAKTNFAPWRNFSGAWNTWNKRANELCNKQSYEIFEARERSYNTAAGPGYVISEVDGYALCSGTILEKKDIEKLIEANRY